MIWLIIFFILLAGIVLIFIYFPNGNLKDLFLIILSTIIGAIGFSFKDYFLEIKEKRKIKDIQKKVVSLFNQYVGTPVELLIDTDGLEDEQEETEILLSALNKKGIDNDLKNILVLCYYCRKWQKTKATLDLDKIKQYSELSEVKYAQINDSVKLFLRYYKKVLSIKDIADDDFENLLKHFIEHFYKDLQFYPLMEELNQTKNFHETLVKIINEGRLSNYGITRETLKKLEKDLKKRANYEKTFLVLLNKANDEIKDYLRSLPGLSGAPSRVRNIDFRNAGYSLFIVKPTKIKSPKEFLEILKNKIKDGSEIIIRVVPLDFINSESYVYPANKSFTNKNLKECYEAIEWFKSGQVFIDSDIWNEIAKSTITTNELLSIIPFNIFCPGILPSEQTFLIKNYESLKSKTNVNLLTEWKDKDPHYLVECLTEMGIPQYTSEEKKYLRITEDNLEEKTKQRLLKISEQIVKGSKKFDEAITKKVIKNDRKR